MTDTPILGLESPGRFLMLGAAGLLMGGMLIAAAFMGYL